MSSSRTRRRCSRRSLSPITGLVRPGALVIGTPPAAAEEGLGLAPIYGLSENARNEQ